VLCSAPLYEIRYNAAKRRCTRLLRAWSTPVLHCRWGVEKACPPCSPYSALLRYLWPFSLPCCPSLLIHNQPTRFMEEHDSLLADSDLCEELDSPPSTLTWPRSCSVPPSPGDGATRSSTTRFMWEPSASGRSNRELLGIIGKGTMGRGSLKGFLAFQWPLRTQGRQSL